MPETGTPMTGAGIDDRYIGLALAISSSFAIGTSIILTKKGLNEASAQSNSVGKASDDYAYLRNPLWWAGMSTMVIGELANFAAYAFAPPILVAPLGALSVIIGAILASFILREELGHLGRIGCALCLLGSTVIVLHAPADKEITTVDEVLRYAVQPGFLLYAFTTISIGMAMIYVVAPRHGRTNPLVYVSICSIFGSMSVMAIKGLGIAIKLTVSGENQFTHPSTYVFGLVVISCILVQMNFFNKALDTFSTNVVNTMYYVGFSSCTILASLILFQGFYNTGGSQTISLFVGFIIIFLGVHLLEQSRTPEAPHPSQHSALESGLINPRLSISGRMSLDGWSPASPNGNMPLNGVGARGTQGHTRRSSRGSRGQVIFNAFEDELPPASASLGRLPEASEEEEDDTDDADERTRLRSKPASSPAARSPRPAPGMQRGSSFGRS